MTFFLKIRFGGVQNEIRQNWTLTLIMANLFFIHTPLELFIAQQIIHQEKLTDNVMLYGYIGDNKHFLDIYDLIQIPSLWKAKVKMLDVGEWADISKRHLLKGMVRTYRRFQTINAILELYGIDTLYLGDMNNFSCKFGATLYKKKGVRIVFFEEGTNHYALITPLIRGGYLLSRVLAIFFDCFYYYPIYHLRFGTWCFVKALPFDKLPIDIRYSAVPLYHETFDRQLRGQQLFSDKLEQFLCQEKGNLPPIGDYILFMSQIIYKSYGNIDLYLQILEHYFQKLNHNQVIIIKFHPREQECDKKAIVRMVERCGFSYHILSDQINIPVEYYLQKITFKEIITFFSSTAMYNGYLYPKMQFTYLLHPYYNLCKEHNERKISQFETFLLSLSDFFQNRQAE